MPYSDDFRLLTHRLFSDHVDSVRTGVLRSRENLGVSPLNLEVVFKNSNHIFLRSCIQRNNVWRMWISNYYFQEWFFFPETCRIINSSAPWVRTFRIKGISPWIILMQWTQERPRQSVSQQPGSAGIPSGVSEQPEGGHKFTHILISAVINYRTRCIIWELF